MHVFTSPNTARVRSHKHADTNAPLQACMLPATHTLFLPQRQCTAGVLLLLMMKSGSDSAALSRVDALQHSAAMLRKFSVSPH